MYCLTRYINDLQSTCLYDYYYYYDYSVKTITTLQTERQLPVVCQSCEQGVEWVQQQAALGTNSLN